jgi:replication initiation and membrane attachment protein DnaB
MFLYSTIGDKAFKQIQKLFEIPKIDRTKYEEVSMTFDQVFKTKDLKDVKGTNNYLVGKKPNKGIIVSNPNFSFDLFKEHISTSFLDGHRISKKFENFIKNLSYVYQFNEEQMAQIFNQSLNNSGYFDYQLCSKVAQKMFKTINDTDHLPVLEVKKESSELEELFRTIDINSLIKNCKGENPTSFELDNVNKLFSEYPYVKREVLNYCIFYSISMCDGEVPPYTYFKKVIDEWLTFDVTTFEQAKAISEKKENKKKKKKSNDPEWLDKYRKNFEEEVEDL